MLICIPSLASPLIVVSLISTNHVQHNNICVQNTVTLVTQAREVHDDKLFETDWCVLSNAYINQVSPDFSGSERVRASAFKRWSVRLLNF